MKRKSYVFMLLISIGGIANGQTISEKIVPLLTLKTNQSKVAEGYGVTADKPLLTGTFKGPMDGMMIRMLKLWTSCPGPNRSALTVEEWYPSILPAGYLFSVNWILPNRK